MVVRRSGPAGAFVFIHGAADLEREEEAEQFLEGKNKLHQIVFKYCEIVCYLFCIYAILSFCLVFLCINT